MKPTVIAVNLSPTHSFSKLTRKTITLIKGIGVEGDAHAGETVKHRFLVGKDPTRPNIRQVHLMHQELFDQLEQKGFMVKPGELGENITTKGIDLLNLPAGTILRIGDEVVVKITALRSPCKQINDYQPGLLKEVLYKDQQGELVRETGVMAIVIDGGNVQPGDDIQVEFPAEPHQKLEYIW